MHRELNTAEQLASFYHLPHGVPNGASCQGLACFVARNASSNYDAHAILPDSRVYCLGKCYAAPSVETAERPNVAVFSREAVILSGIAHGPTRHLIAYKDRWGSMSLAKALQLEPEEIVRCVVDSGLRGRGGAAFPTGKKWAAALRNSSAVKFVVANADEGDPGAYIDRFILEDDPFLLLEGMAIAGYAIGAHKGYVYVRAEYPRAFDILQDAIVTARQSEVLGPHILGTNFAFDVDVIQGHGGYVCGEETALLNAIEGKRPEVRIRPPYPSSSGLFGKPTLVNNVETLANIPWILAHGGEAYRRLGFSNSPGTKVVSLNSLFAKPGLYEIEFGVPVRYIVEELGGGLKSGVLKGLMIGGPLAGILPPTLLDCKFGFEELASVGACVGHGGIVAFDENTSILELIHHVFSFAAYESCGRCFPCRLGTARIESQLDKLIRLGILDGGFESEWDDITNALESATACGFGSGVADFANSVRMHYREELGRCFT